MAQSNIFTNLCDQTIVTMNDAPILNVSVLSDLDGGFIASYYRIIPNTNIFPHSNIARYHGAIHEYGSRMNFRYLISKGKNCSQAIVARRELFDKPSFRVKLILREINLILDNLPNFAKMNLGFWSFLASLCLPFTSLGQKTRKRSSEL